ncbi:amidohydrolase [Sorangium sp. So ce1182]|uniref:amidohydrolase n=1 Tax=Sorangium sp. So ce1182 TaxID=3133334 RepID=UPI003F62FEE1
MSNVLRATLLSLFGSLALGCASPGPPAATATPGTPADLVITAGVVRTMDPAKPRAEAVAVRGERIVFVGSAADTKAFVGPGTRVVELPGRAVVPGLVDGHGHLYGLGVALETPSVRGTRSAEAAAAVVAEAAKARPRGEWITGRGWDQNLWPGAAFPTHGPLDAAAPEHPVALRRVDGHALWANAAAMRAAGVGRGTQDPPGGRVLRDAAGEPTGVFIDNAMGLIEARIPADPPAVRERRILRAAEEALSSGLTGVHEMGIDDETVAVYRALAAAGRLPIRVHAYLAGEGRLEGLKGRAPDVDATGTAMFVLRGVKLYADGALGSRGAALLEPYADEPSTSGLLLMDRGALARAARLVADAGFQLAVHAIGDRANRAVLDAFEALGPGRAAALRFRVEHAQILSPDDLPRFSALGVIASMQPTHATSDMAWAPARLGAHRLKGAYAWRSLRSSGARLVFGSDFPVEEPSPLLGIHAAVTRQDLSGQPPGGWMPEERLDLDEALLAFTAEPAYASWAEGQRGRIAPGYVADLTVLGRDLSPDRSLVDTPIDMVVVGGRVARSGAAALRPDRHPMSRPTQ